MATDTFAGKQGVRWRRATTWVGVLLTVTALASSAAAQQNQTETAGEWARLHGGIELSVTRIADERASFVAPHVGWTLPHEIVLGMALVVPAEDVPVRRTPAAEHTLRLVLGRVLAGYGFDVAGPLAARAGVSFGAGVLSARAGREQRSDGTPVFTVEPGLELSLALGAFVRVGLGVAYRWGLFLDDAPVTAGEFAGTSGLGYVRAGVF